MTSRQTASAPARFLDKVVTITGAASGIGAATARRFAAEGALLGLCDKNGDLLRDMVRDTLDPRRVRWRDVDVSDSAAVEAFIDLVADQFDGIDVLINNAGVGCFGHVDEITTDQWHRTIAVNLDAVFYSSRSALPHLVNSQGCIVNTASISGAFGDPGLVAYNVAKAGVINLTRSMAVDHAHQGVRVNCVCPGGVETPMLKAHMRDEEIMGRYEELVPMRRLGTPDEMAAAIAFLASDDATYITGHALTVDGGVTAQTGQPNFDRLYRARGWDRKLLQGATPGRDA